MPLPPQPQAQCLGMLIGLAIVFFLMDSSNGELTVWCNRNWLLAGLAQSLVVSVLEQCFLVRQLLRLKIVLSPLLKKMNVHGLFFEGRKTN